MLVLLLLLLLLLLLCRPPVDGGGRRGDEPGLWQQVEAREWPRASRAALDAGSHGEVRTQEQQQRGCERCRMPRLQHARQPRPCGGGVRGGCYSNSVMGIRPTPHAGGLPGTAAQHLAGRWRLRPHCHAGASERDCGFRPCVI